MRARFSSRHDRRVLYRRHHGRARKMSSRTQRLWARWRRDSSRRRSHPAQQPLLHGWILRRPAISPRASGAVVEITNTSHGLYTRNSLVRLCHDLCRVKWSLLLSLNRPSHGGRMRCMACKWVNWIHGSQSILISRLIALAMTCDTQACARQRLHIRSRTR